MFLRTEVRLCGSMVSNKCDDLCKIAEAARECLRDSPYRTLRRVSCECKDGILFLRGRLFSFHEKQVAQETVAGVKGTTQVVNEIVVD
ncbi:MAG TPA: BON domain-containing protein [Thermoguttaceae bacterium]